ncbi:MAG: prepilin peptidase [Bacillota bacterium]|nr:prepilin peptidase [Bacillota bacterium]
MLIYPIFTVILGLLIGSFLNVCIFRIPKEQSISYPPSHCMKCGNRIKPYDLIPVVSYIFLKGKCRYCGEKISMRYPLVELTTGLLYLAVYINYGLTLNFIKYIVLISILIVIGMIDFDTTDVYSSTTKTGIIFAIIFIIIDYLLTYNFQAAIVNYILGGVLGGGLIFLIILATRGKGMGEGDAEICLLCGLFLGLKMTGVMLMLSFILGGVIGIILLITKKKSRKDYIPFGPFIALGCILTIFFGQGILNWYLAML